MNSEQFRNIGEAAFGWYWQTEIAGRLGVSPRTIRRWLQYPQQLPPGVETSLRCLLHARQQEILVALNLLDKLTE